MAFLVEGAPRVMRKTPPAIKTIVAMMPMTRPLSLSMF